MLLAPPCLNTFSFITTKKIILFKTNLKNLNLIFEKFLREAHPQKDSSNPGTLVQFTFYISLPRSRQGAAEIESIAALA